MKPILSAFIACGILALVQNTQAKAQDSSPDNAPTYGELSSLTSQIAILKAQAEVADLQRQIAQTKRDTAGLSGQGAVTSLPSLTQANNLNEPLANNLPHVLEISGSGQRLSALLLMPGGGEIEVKPGTPLGNDVFVQSLSTDAVYISQNGYFFALPFANSGMSNSADAPGG